MARRGRKKDNMLFYIGIASVLVAVLTAYMAFTTPGEAKIGSRPMSNAARGHFDAAQKLKKDGKISEAVSEFRQALIKDPDATNTMNLLAITLEEQIKSGQADLKVYDEVKSLYR